MDRAAESPRQGFAMSPQDPLFHIISTNDPPTLAELSLATERIAGVDLELGPLQVRIRTLESKLVPLHGREQTLVRKRQEHFEIMQKAAKLGTSQPAQEDIAPSTKSLHVSPPPPSSLVPTSDSSDDHLISERQNPLEIGSVVEADEQLDALQIKRKTLESQLASFKEREASLLKRRSDLGVPPESPPATELIIADRTLPGQSPVSTKDRPTLEELQLAMESLDKVDLELRPLQDEIKVLVSQLAPLYIREDFLLQRRGQLAPILSPWRRLPSEILSEILQEAVNPISPSFLSDTNTATDRNHFKNLREVCRPWREVAFATHSLWTSVWVDFDQYSDERHPALIAAVGNYFRHSGPSLRLNVGFKWRRDPEPFSPLPGEEGYAFDAWIDYLFSQRSRWEEITFFSQAYHFQLFEARVRKELDLGSGPWKTLFLQVATNSDSLADAPMAPPVAHGVSALYETFPVLETINLSSEEDVLPNEGDLILLDGHSNLRKLRLDIYRDMNPYFTKLGGLRNLKKLLLNCPKLGINPPQTDCPIFEFPFLELLVVSCMPSFTFFTRLRTPTLCTLQILTNIPPSSNHETTSALQRDLWTTVEDLITFIGQCGLNLREFHLNCWFLQGDDALRRLLEALFTVERLCIDTWFVNRAKRGGLEDMLQNLPYLLPRLQKLCIHPIDCRTEKLLESKTESVAASESAGDSRVPQPPGEEQLLLDEGGGAAGMDSMLPFARRHFSWLSFEEFLESAGNRQRGVAGAGKNKLTVCIPIEVCMEAGRIHIRRDAEAAVRSLVNYGLNIEEKPSCKVFW